MYRKNFTRIAIGSGFPGRRIDRVDGMRDPSMSAKRVVITGGVDFLGSFGNENPRERDWGGGIFVHSRQYALWDWVGPC